jgi:hypothetical protein
MIYLFEETGMLNKVLLALAIAAASGCAPTQHSQQAAQRADEGVFFVEPKDGASVPQEFKVVMGVTGMQVRPLGDMSEKTGHHHLLINADDVPAGTIVPVDKPDQYKHFGKGQTETMVKLAPGEYKLTLQFADGAHTSYGEKMRSSITVNVQ